jgi:hypothetical protein
MKPSSSAARRCAILASALVPLPALASGAPGGDGIVFIVLALAAQALLILACVVVALVRGNRSGWRAGLGYWWCSVGLVVMASVVAWSLALMLSPAAPPTLLGVLFAWIVGLPLLSWVIHLWWTRPSDRLARGEVGR